MKIKLKENWEPYEGGECIFIGMLFASVKHTDLGVYWEVMDNTGEVLGSDHALTAKDAKKAAKQEIVAALAGIQWG